MAKKGPRLLSALARGPGALPRAARSPHGNTRTIAVKLAEKAREVHRALAAVEADQGLNEIGKHTKRAGTAAIHQAALAKLRAEVVDQDRFAVMRASGPAWSAWRTASTRQLEDIPVGRAVAAAMSLQRLADLKPEQLGPLLDAAVKAGDFATLDAVASAPILFGIPDDTRKQAAELAHRAAAPDLAAAYDAAEAAAAEVREAFDALELDLGALADGTVSIDGTPDLADARRLAGDRAALGEMPDGEDEWFTDGDDSEDPSFGASRIAAARAEAGHDPDDLPAP